MTGAPHPRLGSGAVGELPWTHRWSTAALYALTAAGYPLISSIPIFLGLQSRAASMPYRAAILGLSLLVIAQNIRRRNVYLGSVWFPLGLFCLLYTLRLFSDTVFFPVTVKLSTAEYFAWIFGSCFIPMVAFLSAPDERTLKLSLWLTMLTTIVACIASLYGTYLALLSGNSTTFATGRLANYTLESISFGYLGATTALLSAHLIVTRLPILVRLGLAVTLTGGLGILGAAASRGPILAFIIIGLLVGAVSLRGRPARKAIPIIAGGVLIAVVFIVGLIQLEERFGFRVLSRLGTVSALTSDDSGAEHINVAVDAWQDFLDHPVFGSGIDESRRLDYPHNVLIESFMATGIVGGVAFGLLVAAWGIASLRLLSDPLRRWLALLCLLALLAALTSGALYLAGTMWCLGAAVVAIESRRRRDAALRGGVGASAHTVAALPPPGA